MAVTRSTVLALCATASLAFLNATENDERLTLSNDRLYASVVKDGGNVDALFLDEQDLLGTRDFTEPAPGGATGNGNSGIGPYLDCYCTPEGFYTPGSIDPRYTLLNGTDSTGTEWGGIVLSETYPSTGQVLEQYWFLREGETGLHTFSRIYYNNATTPFLRNLQEFRTLYRPNTPLWTNLTTNEIQTAPLPSPNPAAGGSDDNATTVQDATWRLNDENDPYVIEFADWFTKYTFSTEWRDHKVHGLYSDGSTSNDGSTFGSWMVMNTKDTYFGGPLHSDLVVDGIVYNYISSNHHGDQTPNITDGFDRTFGPQFFYFNKGAPNASVEDLRQDAMQYADPEWNVDFYDSIAEHVPGYLPSSGRGSWSGKIKLPAGAKNAIAVLAQDEIDFQDNVFDTKAYQYWADIDPHTGEVHIPQVKEDNYRLTVYAAGIFGNYIQEHVTVCAGETTETHAYWEAESAGTELWRIGYPDKSSGEYRHGYERDPTHPLHPPEYLIYWAAYDFPNDFPDGVNFRVGESDESQDLNYVHWSVYGGYANSQRTEQYEGDGDVNNWTIAFDVEKHALEHKSEATFTVQLAGAKTAAGNTDVFNATEPWSNLPLNVFVNGNELEPWVIPYYQSSSCAVRSGVICYNLAHQYVFNASLLKAGDNEMVLNLPYNATDYESALLPRSVYVQYDAMRLEVC